MADTIESVDVAGVHGQVALNPDGTAIGTPVGGATASNQTNGSQKTQIVDAGGEVVTVTGGRLDVNATASLAGQAIPVSGATEAVAVQIVDGSGNQIASFGGGTQYTEGDTDATLTGTVAMVEGAANAVAPMTQPLTDTQLRATAVPVSGTVTAELSATDNAVLDTIDAVLDTINAKLVTGTVIGDVNLGATDNAVLDNIDASLNNIETDAAAIEVLLGTIDADTGNMATSLGSLDNAVDGNYINVNMNVAGTDVVSGSGTATGALRVELPTNGTGVIATVGAVTAITNALPAGTNNIGDVDVLSIVPGSGATNLGKAEDGGHTSGDVGVMALGVRNDTPNVAIAGTDLDYAPIATSKTGAVYVMSSEEDFAVLGSNKVNKTFNLTGAQTDAIIWSPAAGKRWYITDIHYVVSAAATVTFEDDLVAGDAVVGIGGAYAANSGLSRSFKTPVFSNEDAADLLLTTTAGNIQGIVTGYEI